MLISAKKISKIWKIKPSGVIHIGAHHAEEMPQYLELGWGHMYWVEANPILADTLAAKLEPAGNTVINCAAWDVDKVSVNFNETTDSQSSSLLPLKRHSIYYPEVHSRIEYKVQARRMDCIFDSPPQFTFANIDVQGAELQVIRGMGNLLHSMDAVYLEVNREELYENCARIQEIDEYLHNFSFRRVTTRWVLGKGWGDALYLNMNRITISKSSILLTIIAAAPFYLKQIMSNLVRSMGLMPIARRAKGKFWPN